MFDYEEFLLVLFCLLLSMPGKAQDFYSSNDIEISWKYWDDDNGWEWLINNGTKYHATVKQQQDQ